MKVGDKYVLSDKAKTDVEGVALVLAQRASMTHSLFILRADPSIFGPPFFRFDHFRRDTGEWVARGAKNWITLCMDWVQPQECEKKEDVLD